MSDKEKKAVIQANVDLHSKLASSYNANEPHFRPENIENVKGKIAAIAKQTLAKRLLDLGCGTGFIISIAKNFVGEIDGVDITEAMLNQVDKTGPARINLHVGDTGQFPAKESHYDIVTSYTFLHHLYSIDETLRTAHRALRPGGIFYVDLEPNFYFWEKIKNLDEKLNYDPIVKREIAAVNHRDSEIEKSFGVSKETFNNAEYSKNILGGFKEEDLRTLLAEVGFRKVDFFYNWFLGQGSLINDSRFKVEDRFKYASVTDEILQRVLPLSRHIFKYLGFFATK